jgi:hypothetical protein
MTILATTDLTHAWRVEYFEHDPDLYEFAPDPLTVDDLSRWTSERRYDETWAALLTTTFFIAPVDQCIAYWLDFHHPCAEVVLYINERRIGTFTGHNRINVTDYVWLDDNVLQMRVDCGTCTSEAPFSAIRLLMTPCDEAQ